MFESLWGQLFVAALETTYMTFCSSMVAIFLGLPLGIFLFLSRKNQLLAHAWCYQALNSIVNIGRSIPFVILMIALIPITRLIIGTSIGTTAAIVPLAVAAIPFFARLVESALLEIAPGLIEAAIAMGATTWQIVIKILLPEAKVTLIHHVTLMVITLVGYSAMAGAVGGGGLGDLAVRYGYQRFDVTVMMLTILILVLLIQCLQWLGNICVKRFSPE